jgi:uncharacterized membrane protein YfcA
MDFDQLTLAALFFLVAALYSSVGHAGASGYLAVMALLGFAPEQMRPTALALNILVGGIGLFRFHQAKLVPWRKVLPFVLASIPCAYISAQWHIPKQTYSLLLAGILLIAAVGAWRSGVLIASKGESFTSKPIPIMLALLIGAVIGCLSGITGTGGAIFLTPLLLFFYWAHTRQASGLSVAFVWLNSLAAIIGLMQSNQTIPDALPIWLVAVALGALVGTQLGIHQWPTHRLRKGLAVVLMIAAGKLLIG